MGFITIIFIIVIILKLKKNGMFDDIIKNLNNISQTSSSSGVKTNTTQQDKRYATVNSHYSESTIKPKKNESSPKTLEQKQLTPKAIKNDRGVTELYKEWHQSQVESKKQWEQLLKAFENRETDWLAQQLKYEKKATQWLDFDSRNTHPICDAEALKNEHRLQHDML